MAHCTDLFKRIDILSSRASRDEADSQLLAEMEDVLAQGYMAALTGEAKSRRLGRDLEGLVERIDEPGAADEARRIASERRTLDRMCGELRSRLSDMRAHFVRLGGGQSAAR